MCFQASVVDPLGVSHIFILQAEYIYLIVVESLQTNFSRMLAINWLPKPAG